MSLILPDTIKFVITDFDGIITDNCVYIDGKGEMSRKLNFKDIMAFSILKKNGYKIGIISGEANSAIELLNKKFCLDEIHQGIRVKIDVLKNIIEKYSLSQEEFLYIGDDINDVQALEYSKYAITVPEAVSKVKNIKDIQMTSASGGAGAFREVVDSLVK